MAGLTTWRVLPEKLKVAASYGTGRFITVFTKSPLSGWTDSGNKTL
jgi:hypothetical protein